ncbi:MAG: biotin--[acetyl-CoA-carboxylase] ligase [Alphaproteobacteria bacterium]
MKFDIRTLETTVSTNDDVKQAAETGAAEGLVIQALQQSGGRGRQGRQWQSPVGNLYFSVLLRPKVALRDYARYSFIAALAIGDTIRGYLSEASVELKWPNDVLVGGKKISGILLEAGDGWLVVGMGINVLHTPENPLYPATSLVAEMGAAPSLDVVLGKILESLSYWIDTADNQGFAPIRTAWLSHARKGAMRIRQPRGEDGNEIHGEFVDLDTEGNLRLRLPDGTERSISTGDVFF